MCTEKQLTAKTNSLKNEIGYYINTHKEFDFQDMLEYLHETQFLIKTNGVIDKQSVRHYLNFYRQLGWINYNPRKSPILTRLKPVKDWTLERIHKEVLTKKSTGK